MYTFSIEQEGSFCPEPFIRWEGALSVVWEMRRAAESGRIREDRWPQWALRQDPQSWVLPVGELPGAAGEESLGSPPLCNQDALPSSLHSGVSYFYKEEPFLQLKKKKKKVWEPLIESICPDSFLKFIFNRRIIASECCVGFPRALTWTSRRFTAPCVVNLLSCPTVPHPSGWSGRQAELPVWHGGFPSALCSAYRRV